MNKNRKAMVAGNWKMNKTIDEARALIREIIPSVQDCSAVEVVLCPPFLALEAARAEIKGSTLQLGAQNMHWAESGAYTGEISASMLVGICDYVILGHSERRTLFGESNQGVNKKIVACLHAGIRPIVCVGETLEENQAGKTAEVLDTQMRESLQGLTSEQATQLVIAYEPVWAIGTGMTATPQQAQDVHGKILRPLFAELFGTEVARNLRILYGGSVKADNAAELFAMQDIDGGLIGGASLKAKDFVAIVKAAC